MLACLESKSNVSVARKSSKRPIFSVPSQWFTSKNDFKFCVEPQGSFLLWGLKKDNEIWDQNHRYAHFWFIRIFERFSALKVLILEKVENWENGSFSRLLAYICLKKEIKELFLKFWSEICLNLWFFVLKFRRKGICSSNRAYRAGPYDF